MNLDDLRNLTTVAAPIVAEALNISLSSCYELARRGELPVRSLSLGRARRFIVQGPGGLLAALGLDPETAEAARYDGPARTERHFDDGDDTPLPRYAARGRAASSLGVASGAESADPRHDGSISGRRTGR